MHDGIWALNHMQCLKLNRVGVTKIFHGIRENRVLRRNRFLDLFVVMATGLRVEDKLDWAVKARIDIIAEE